MKKIFITINDGSIARNILRSFVLKKLLEEKEVTVGLVTHEAKASLYRQEFGSERIKVFSCPPHVLTLYERILSYLIRNGLKTKTILMDQRTHRDDRHIVFLVKRVLIYSLGRLQLFHMFIRWLFLWRSPSVAMREIFLHEKPDILFSTDVQAELDFDAIAAARRVGTRIVGMVRSWDNLTARGGLVPYIPEKLLVWSSYLLRQAVSVQHIPKERIVMVGIPQFDWYVKKELLMPREEFLKRVGIEPPKKFILFGGEGAFHAPHEVEVLEILSGSLRAGELQRGSSVAVLFRPHPAFKVDEDRARRLDNILFDNGASGYSGVERSSWEMGKAHLVHFMNSLYHADLVITTASTVALDAIAFDKPVVCVAFDGKSREPYWSSARRYYRDYTHFADLTALNGFRVAYSKEELISSIDRYLKDSHQDAEGRRKIREEFIGKLDGRSAERIAGALLQV